jgi:hypothetical protein
MREHSPDYVRINRRLCVWGSRPLGGLGLEFVTFRPEPSSRSLVLQPCLSYRSDFLMRQGVYIPSPLLGSGRLGSRKLGFWGPKRQQQNGKKNWIRRAIR